MSLPQHTHSGKCEPWLVIWSTKMRSVSIWVALRTPAVIACLKGTGLPTPTTKCANTVPFSGHMDFTLRKCCPIFVLMCWMTRRHFQRQKRAPCLQDNYSLFSCISVVYNVYTPDCCDYSQHLWTSGDLNIWLAWARRYLWPMFPAFTFTPPLFSFPLWLFLFFFSFFSLNLASWWDSGSLRWVAYFPWRCNLEGLI